MDINLRRVRGLSWFGCLLALSWIAGTAPAQTTLDSVIPASRRVDWSPGVTVGVSASVSRSRTNLINVTRAPYNADRTGATSATAAIQAAIDAAKSNDVVYLPTGRYRLNSLLTIDKSHITIRGDGPTNTVLLGLGAASCVLKVGHDGMAPSSNTTYYVTSGATKGSSVLNISNTVDFFGNRLTSGDLLMLSTETRQMGNSTFPVISVGNFDRIIRQLVAVKSVSGNVVNLRTPLVFDMTNAPTLTEVSPMWYLGTRSGIGVEKLGITLKNGTETGSAPFLIAATSLVDSWFSELDLGFANNYQVYFSGVANCELSGSYIHDSLTTGTSHAGLIVATSSSLLVENNIFANGLFPAIEFNEGVVGCAFAYNYFTNCVLDIDCHNTHPMMNLWEGNVLGNSFQMDGYFGSASHQTLYRNRIPATTSLKRWTTHMNILGNVLGAPSVGYVYSREEAGYSTPHGIFEFGFPNMGNRSYTGTTPPMAWNYPGKSLLPFNSPFVPIPNGIYTFTEDQGPTNRLYGNFSNVPAAPGTALYPLIFQDGVDTNKYYGSLDGGELVATEPGTSTSITLNKKVTVKKGWTVYIAGQNSYQQLQSGDKLTHLIHGNLIYTNAAGSLVWQPGNANRTLPASLLYSGGPPAWWGTNRWPAIDSMSADAPVRSIPAEVRAKQGGPVGGALRPAPPASSPRVL